jgi:adenylosuccinate synthase
MINAVVGLNWGDEGKGRVVDYLASKADCVIRFQGGDNAGHTVVNGFGKTALHNFPSGIFNGNCLNIIASGSVINPESFAAEKQELDCKGAGTGNLIISDRSVLILPCHILLDRLEEERLGKRKYGSTLSGIAPVYGLRYMKKGIQAGELLHPAYLKEHAGAVLEYVNAVIRGVYGSEPVKLAEVLDWLEFHGKTLKPLIADTVLLSGSCCRRIGASSWKRSLAHSGI